MNVVMVIPTGIGCEIGGHAGDANPVAKLLGKCCDKLILHPNVVNACDINEMPENALYIEGSILDRFLEGSIYLEKPRHQNKILLVANKIDDWVINAVNASRVTLGIDIVMAELEHPLQMIATKMGKVATGKVTGWRELCNQVMGYRFDALAVYTPIDCEEGVKDDYYKNGGVNPWGGVEAKASRMVATQVNKPVTHAPPFDTIYSYEGKVDSRIAPEIISNCYLHCVLKGLQWAPRISQTGLSVADVDVLVSPYCCWGRPHEACLDKDIPIIVVLGNETVYDDTIYDESEVDMGDPRLLWVNNYMEAAGLIMAMRAGVTRESITRPI